MAFSRVDLGMVVWCKSSDGLRCFAPLSILRVFVIIGGVTGRRHGVLTNRLGIGGVAQIARRIALLCAAIHPPDVCDYRGRDLRRMESASRLPSWLNSRWCGLLLIGSFDF
tara:strand:- start:82 stop:414 length:333 start_codon:yes stop_codon:yes gene_type:complete